MTSPEPVQSVETLAYSDIAGLGQIYASAESTTAPMATQFQALMTQFLADVSTAQSSPTTANVAQVAADIQQIEALAQNGMADPNNPGDSLFLTTEMANVVGEINSSLQASGITVPVPGTSGFSSFAFTSTTQFSSWYSANNSVGNSSATPPVPNGIFALVTDPTGVSTSPIPQLQADTTASLISNQTLQALIDVEYISQGNAMIGEQMNSVSSALNALQTTITQLNSLQGLMSQIAAPASVTISTSAFNNTSATTATSYVSSVFSANENPNPIIDTGTAAYATFVMVNGVTVTLTDINGNPLSGSGPVQQVDLINAVWNLEALYTELQGNGIATGTSGQINGTGATVAGTGLAPGTTGAGFSATLPGSIFQVIQDISSYIPIPVFPPANVTGVVPAPIPPLVGSQGPTVAAANYVISNGTFVATATILPLTTSSNSGEPVTSTSNPTGLESFEISASDATAVALALGIPLSYSDINAGDQDDNGTFSATTVVYSLVPPLASSQLNPNTYYTYLDSNGTPLSQSTLTPNTAGLLVDVVNATQNEYSPAAVEGFGTNDGYGSSPWIPVDANGVPIQYSSIQISAQLSVGNGSDNPPGSSNIAAATITVIGLNGATITPANWVLNRTTVPGGEYDDDTDTYINVATVVYPVATHFLNPNGVTMVTATDIELVTSQGGTTAYYAIDPTTGQPILAAGPATVVPNTNTNGVNVFGGYPTDDQTNGGGNGLPFGLPYNFNIGFWSGGAFDGDLPAQTIVTMSYSLNPTLESASIIQGYTNNGDVTFNVSGTIYDFSPTSYPSTNYDGTYTTMGGPGTQWAHNSLDPVGYGAASENSTGATNLQYYAVDANGNQLSFDHLEVTVSYDTNDGGSVTYLGSSVIPVDANGNPIPGFAEFVEGNLPGGGYAPPITTQSVWGYILDGQNSTGGVASAASGNNQNDLTTALTASQNVNADQQQSLQRYLFVFQEFYQSAGAILTTIQDMMSKMAQGINGQ